jgi:CDP-diacylglycerol--glycerol-3-phosphate 3-phosphatidyltransferase
MIFNNNVDLFKWMLALNFFTDLIDGYLARKFRVTSALGSLLDSVADDLTMIAAIIGVFVLKPEFVKVHLTIVIILFALLVLQNTLALAKYHKISSFHTYLAKTAAIFQGLFLIFLFLLPQPVYFLFYGAILITALDLIEEIILVFILPKWETNVKGLYWVMKRKNTN